MKIKPRGKFILKFILNSVLFFTIVIIGIIDKIINPLDGLAIIIIIFSFFNIFSFIRLIYYLITVECIFDDNTLKINYLKRREKEKNRYYLYNLGFQYTTERYSNFSHQYYPKYQEIKYSDISDFGYVENFVKNCDRRERNFIYIATKNRRVIKIHNNFFTDNQKEEFFTLLESKTGLKRKTDEVNFTKLFKETSNNNLRIKNNLYNVINHDNTALEGTLICDCCCELFNVYHSGKCHRFFDFITLKKQDNQIIIKCKCVKCNKEYTIYDSTRDGINPIGSPIHHYDKVKMIDKDRFKVHLLYNYEKENFMTNRYSEFFLEIKPYYSKKYKRIYEDSQ